MTKVRARGSVSTKDRRSWQGQAETTGRAGCRRSHRGRVTTPPEYIGMTIYLGEKQFVLPLITYYFLGRVFLGSGPGACRWTLFLSEVGITPGLAQVLLILSEATREAWWLDVRGPWTQEQPLHWGRPLLPWARCHASHQQESFNQ